MSGSFFNSRGEFRDASVLLGVEVAEDVSPRNGIYVEKDPARLRVLYVFLVPSDAVVPTGATMSAAMLQTSNELRSSVAKRPTTLGGWFRR